MTYNISDRIVPAMPKPSKGTEIVKLPSYRPRKTCTNRIFR